MYIDYEFYYSFYKGTIPQEKFDLLEIKASGILNYYTFNRASKKDTNVKLAICELIDNLYEIESTDTKGIDSEKVGTYSVSYSKDHKKNLKLEQKEIINKYLGHTNLLYRGV